MSVKVFEESRLTPALGRVRDALEEACVRSGRNPDEVTLVAVTKGHPLEVVDAALSLGLRELGENRVEALLERAALRPDPAIRWHMVGRLQRRKAPRLIGPCHLVHSVDSLRLGERLSQAAAEAGVVLDILAQVNVAGEEAKTGWAPEEAEDDLLALGELPGLRLRGLMTMAPFTEDEGVLRGTFAGLRELHETLLRQGYPGTELSMGMSHDFEIAVEEGSTLVRLGTALFGERAS